MNEPTYVFSLTIHGTRQQITDTLRDVAARELPDNERSMGERNYALSLTRVARPITPRPAEMSHGRG